MYHVLSSYSTTTVKLRVLAPTNMPNIQIKAEKIYIWELPGDNTTSSYDIESTCHIREHKIDGLDFEDWLVSIYSVDSLIQELLTKLRLEHSLPMHLPIIA